MRNAAQSHVRRRRNNRWLGSESLWSTRTFSKGRTIKREQPSFSVEKKQFDDFGIPGLSIAYNPQYGRLTKIICIAVITGIYMVCLHQVSVRIKNYFQNPVSIDAVVERQQYLHFPTVTICPWYPLKHNRKLFELRRKYCTGCKDDNQIWSVDVFDLLLLPNTTMQQIWDMAAIIPSNIRPSPIMYNEFLRDDLQIITQEVTTFMGICLSARFSQPLHYYGGFTGISIDVLDAPNMMYWNYMIILHEDPEELPHSIVRSAGISFHHNFETDVTFSIKQYEYANTSTNTCQTPTDYRSCLAKCSERLILSLITCRLPYINAKHLNDCSTPQDARHTYNVTTHVYASIDDLCKKCRRPCRVNLYGLSMDCIKAHNPTRIKALLTNNFVERITETASYNFVMFFGDIGGTVGFFLGMCVINVVHMLTSLTSWVTRTFLTNSRQTSIQFYRDG